MYYLHDMQVGKWYKYSEWICIHEKDTGKWKEYTKIWCSMAWILTYKCNTSVAFQIWMKNDKYF